MKAILFLLAASISIASSQEVWTFRHTMADFARPTAVGGMKGLYMVATNIVDQGMPSDIRRHLTSKDGVSWTAAALPDTKYYLTSGDEVIGLGFYGIWRTTDGLGYNWLHKPLNGISNPNGIAEGNGCRVAVISGGVILRSTGGEWLPQLSPSGNINGIVFGNGIFLASTEDDRLIKSTDGITWVNTGIQYNDVLRTYGKGFYIGSALRASTSLVVSQLPLVNRYGYFTTFGGGHFVSLGYMGEVGISTTLESWTSKTIGITGSLSFAAFCGDLWVGASGEGRIVTSPVVGVPPLVAPTISIKPAVELTWPSLAGRQYQVQGSNDNTVWTNVGLPLLGDGSTLTYTAPSNETRKFFRVEAR